MIKANLKASSSLIVAFVLVAASILWSAPCALGQDSVDLSQWSESSSRAAGTRRTLTIGGAEYVFRWIPAGEFEMGSPTTENGRFNVETLHRVRLTRGFWMLETEVTQTLYKEIMGTNPSANKGDDLPVEEVSQRDATEFCEELTKLLPAGLKPSLPTEAQWEYACRAGTKTAYSYGDSADSDKMNCDSTGTKRVKTFAANRWGLYDMHGNVWEWTSDSFGDYPTGAVDDPRGSAKGSYRALRGGGWGADARDCRSARRFRGSVDSHARNLGFRFALICDEPSSRPEEPESPSPVVESTPANQSSSAETSPWAESITRRAGTRRTLRVGGAEYGFVWIPAGEFEMGSPESEEGRFYDETLHHVRLTKGFWMLETETTQALYKEVMGENPSDNKGDNLPVERVLWSNAMKFCTELTKRLPAGLTASLPTEAQWEYACRAGTTTAYSYGDSADSSKMNYSKGHSTPAKTYPANPWGLYDMHGNVCEWCLDYFGDYPTGSAIDPKGPNIASNHAYRGGSWRDDARYCRSAYRGRYDAGNRRDNVGFRVLLSSD